MTLPGTPTMKTSSLALALQRAERRLQALPPQQPVRLAKHTSNLFRARQHSGARLDLHEFSTVFAVDESNQRALVGGLTTYEDLVATTLPYGLVPLCVPQLRTITLGGAVTGMGVEAASFRNGAPHESVVAMDILTGTGEVVHARADNEHADLFTGFPNSYGSLGYALLLEIELEAVKPFVHLTNVRLPNSQAVVESIEQIVGTGQWAGERVDYLDATVFTPTSTVLTLGRYTDEAQQPPSDYTGQQIYYQSLNRNPTDLLSIGDYLWRWDTDWFWCSKALGAQNPVLRRVWPRRYLRSDAYWKIVALERRYGLANRVRSWRGGPPREPVVQDIEVPLAALPEFLEFFHHDVGITPIWLCPMRQRDPQARWPLYQFEPGQTYVNVGFWSSVERETGRRSLRRPGQPADRGQSHRTRRAQVAVFHRVLLAGRVRSPLWRIDLSGTQGSLRSESTVPADVRQVRSGRLSGESRTDRKGCVVQLAEVFEEFVGPDVDLEFVAYDGSKAGRIGSDVRIDVRNQKAVAALLGAPGQLGLVRAYVSGDLVIDGDLFSAFVRLGEAFQKKIPWRTLPGLVKDFAPYALQRTGKPPEEIALSGRKHGKSRDAEAIAHHYDVSNAFYEMILGPSMAYTCAVYPERRCNP